MHYTDEFKLSECRIDLNIKKYCSLPYCINSKVINKNLSLFVFPKNRKRCEKWLSGCDRCYLHDIFEQYGTNSLNMCCLCEEHFETSQFTDLTLERLISNAVPTLFQRGSVFCQRIGATLSRKTEKSPETHPCSSSSFQNQPQNKQCIQRLMPLFPNLKVYYHPFLHDLPSNLTIRKSNQQGAQYGVWSTEDIPIGARYGPFDTATSLPKPKNRLTVQYFHKTDQQKNGEKTARTMMTLFINWLQYVNLACNEEQQNLLVYQCQGKIYYLCYKPIPANTELLVWYGPYHTPKEERKEYYSMKEMEESVHCSPFCHKHKISWEYLSEMEISHSAQNLAAILRVKGNKTENQVLKLATKELNNLETISRELSLEKSKEQTRFQILKKHLLLLTSRKGYNGTIADKLKLAGIRKSIRQRERISNSECEERHELFHSMQHLAVVLGVEGRTGKEILDLTSFELKRLEEIELKLLEKKSIEKRKHRLLKRRLFLTSDLKNSSMEPSTKYCIMCEHNYSHKVS